MSCPCGLSQDRVVDLDQRDRVPLIGGKCQNPLADGSDGICGKALGAHPLAQGNFIVFCLIFCCCSTIPLSVLMISCGYVLIMFSFYFYCLVMSDSIVFLNLEIINCFNLSLDLDFSETRFRKSQRPEGGSEKTCFLNFCEIVKDILTKGMVFA
jgi:hypothetical protein